MLLSFSNVSFSYPNSEKILNNISFSIADGEKVALLGLNGAGKSTLILHTNGLLIPSEGNVWVKSMNTKNKEIREIRKTVGIVFQNPDDQLFMPTVWDDIAFGPQNMNLSKEEIERRVESAMLATDTKHLADKPPFELSGGQKKAVSIATILSMNPELIVMDEPTSGLDYLGVSNLISVVKKLPQTLLISTHDIQMAGEICNRAIILEKGQIIYDGAFSSMKYPPANNSL